MRMSEHPQRSEQWFAERLGLPTASNFGKLITPTGKSTTGKTRETYINELIAESVTGKRQEHFVTYAMQWGIDNEDIARSEFQTWYAKDNEITDANFCFHEIIACGASPDAFIDSDGLLEIKCPQPATLIGYHREGILPDQYKAQVQGQLWVCERDYCKFFAWHPDIPPFLFHVERDEQFIQKLESEIMSVASTIASYSEELRNR